MRARLVAAIWLAALWAGGCGEGPGGPCDSPGDCPGALVCDPVTRACRDPGAGYDAGPGTDALPPAATDAAPGTDAVPAGSDAAVPSGGETGAPCVTDAGCAPAGVGATPICWTAADGFPGGYCTNMNCSTSLQDCPGADSICWEPMPGAGAGCLDRCNLASGDADCRSGYNCIDLGFGGACLPLCVSDADCPPGSTCDPTTFMCR